MVRGTGVEVPNRAGGTWAKQQLNKARDHRNDTPESLLLDEINEATAIFQPRFDSIAYAPGRSERHVQQLRKTLRRGNPLDAVSVVSFGQEWYLVDGHHRLAAYRDEGWSKGVPVRVEHSDATGYARIAWATRLSVTDNVKDRLPTSPEDKVDSAWRMTVAAIGNPSKLEVADTCDVSTAVVGNMRSTLRALRDHQVSEVELGRLGWRHAKSKLANLTEGGGGGADNWDKKRKQQLARKLKTAMVTNPSAALLAETLESFRPGIVFEMHRAQEIAAKAEEDAADDD